MIYCSRNIVLTRFANNSGQQLLIKASGNVKQRIEEGAYVKLTVKYGLIKLLTTTANLCEQFANVDMKCPIEEGEQTIEKTVDLPVEIPPVSFVPEAQGLVPGTLTKTRANTLSLPTSSTPTTLTSLA